MIPRKMFLTKGTGVHNYRLHSFELALRDASIEACNLVKVSSIIPPSCELISIDEGISILQPGQITYCVLSVHRTKRRLHGLGSCIGLAFPKDPAGYGYIAEHHGSDVSKETLILEVEELARTMLTTTKKGTISLLSQTDFIQRSSTEISPIDCSVRNICSYVSETQAGRWTTVLTAAIFIVD